MSSLICARSTSVLAIDAALRSGAASRNASASSASARACAYESAARSCMARASRRSASASSRSATPAMDWTSRGVARLA
jgi:hypothetical protein